MRILLALLGIGATSVSACYAAPEYHRKYQKPVYRRQHKIRSSVSDDDLIGIGFKNVPGIGKSVNIKDLFNPNSLDANFDHDFFKLPVDDSSSDDDKKPFDRADSSSSDDAQSCRNGICSNNGRFRRNCRRVCKNGVCRNVCKDRRFRQRCRGRNCGGCGCADCRRGKPCRCQYRRNKQ